MKQSLSCRRNFKRVPELFEPHQPRTNTAVEQSEVEDSFAEINCYRRYLAE